MACCLPSKARRGVVNGLDCMCSSVLVNCCQFSCCMHDVPNVEFRSHEEDLHNPNWMGELIEKDPDIKLRDVIIPGTHDSGSYSLHWMKLFSAVGRCQQNTLKEQLLLGARYLDIRVGGASSGGDNEVSVWHGCLECCRFNEEFLTQIIDFFNEHPKEFVFLDIVQEYGKPFSNAQKMYTLGLLQNHFQDKVFQGSRSDLMDEKPLSEIIEGGKNLVVMIHGRFFSDDFEVDGVKYTSKQVEETYGFVHSGRFMRSHWHNTRDLDNLLQWNLEEVQKYGGKEHGQILNNQFILTPGVGGAPDVLSLLVGMLSLRPSSFAAKLYKKDVLDNFFSKHADEPWNLVQLDYINLTPALVSFLINLNFPAELKVSLAAVHDGTTTTDVTETVRGHIKRSKVLYLPDIEKDLAVEGGSSEGTLVIAYKLGDANYSILSIDFDAETELVLGQFSRNEEAVVVNLDTESTGPTGFIKDGQVIGGEASEGLGDGGITFKYTVAEDDPSSCAFEIVGSE